MEHNVTKILRVDASARLKNSNTRKLGDAVIGQFPDAVVTHRDLAADPVPQINEDWVGANFTPADQREPRHDAQLSRSDALVREIEQADLLIITVPIYNFGIPAALKAWVDQIARAGRTFRYTPEGPQGLLKDKKAILLIASGGTEVDSAIDFATPYMRHVLAFLGITDLTVVPADRLVQEPTRMNQALDRASELASSLLKAA